MSLHTRSRALAPATATFATALALSACGSSSTMPGMSSQDMSSMTLPTSSVGSASVGTPAPGPKNDADVAFATQMIAHHASAIQMAEMALKQATNAEVKSLAAQIKAAQGPEIQQMSGWLAGWGAPVPDTSMNLSMGGMDMGGMSAQEMSDLGKATGNTFDRMWLQLMTKHHQGAVEMAKKELTDGQNSEAKKVAQSIVDSQTKEISAMRQLLGTLPG